MKRYEQNDSRKNKKRKTVEETIIEIIVDEFDDEQTLSNSTRKRTIANGEDGGGSPLKRHKNKHPDEDDDEEEEGQNYGDLSGLPGHIEHIRLVNFMCHEHFELKFNPLVNVINGQNGSGKSAILTAIMLAFGVRASSTNRGKELKQFIKTGMNCAKIELTICNYGRPEDEKLAYRPDVYGPTIKIERIIKNSGNNEIKTRNGSNNKVIASGLQEINDICGHFRYKINNPVAVLTQEISKYFLNSQNPEKLYQFYMQATQLDQIENDVHSHKDILRIHCETVEQSKQILRSKQDYYERITEKKIILDLLKGKADSIPVLELEIKSALINQSKTKIEKLEQTVQTITKEVEAEEILNKKLLEMKEKVRQRYMECRDSEGSFQDELEELKKKYEDLKADRSTKQQFEEVSKKFKLLQTSITNSDKILKQRQNEYESARKDRDSNYEDDVKKIEQEIAQTKRQIDQLNDIISSFRTAKEIKEDQTKINELNEKVQESKSKEQSLIGTINTFSKYTTPQNFYGTEIEQFRTKIEQNKHLFKDQVFGPLGMYIKVNDPKDAYIIEKVLGQSLTSFLTTNHEDFKILSEMGKSIWRKKSNFPSLNQRKTTPPIDVSEHSAKYKQFGSIWDLFVVEQPEVGNFLIDTKSPEQVLYIPDSNEAEECALNQAEFCNNSKNCKRIYSTNGHLILLNPYRSYPCDDKFQKARYLAQSRQSILEFNESELKTVQKQIESLQDEQSKLKNSVNIEQNEHSLKINQRHNLKKRLDTLKQNKLQIEQKNSDIQVTNLEKLEDKIASIERILNNERKDLDEIRQKRDDYRQQFEEHKNTVQMLKRQYDEFLESNDFEQKLTKLKKNIAKIEERISKNHVDINQLEEKKAEKVKEIEDERKILEEIQASVLNENVIETDRSIEDITMDLNRIKAAKQTNWNILRKDTEINEEFCRVDKDIQQLKTNFIELRKIENIYIQGIKKRAKLFADTERNTIVKLNKYFQQFLTEKNMIGEVKVEYEASSGEDSKRSGKVFITSRPKINEQGNNPDLLYDSKSLSGGERSFSTVSLILSLWRICNFPVRILDEVDVFMDDITRTICVQALIDFAKQQGTGQFIFLSPIVIPDLKPSTKITIFTMPRTVQQ